MKEKILIIEDDPLMAELLADKLSKADFEVSLVVDAAGFFKELEGQLPDIILLDLILPGMSGFDILDKIKKEERTKNVPVIILSNLGDKEEIEKGLALGADSYLVKSNVLIEEVIRKIKEILQRKKPS